MTGYIVAGLVGALIGFGLALVFNHKNAKGFDKLTEQADKERERITEKLK